MADEGGDAPCWADRLCDACGQITEDPGTHRCPPIGAASYRVARTPGWMSSPRIRATMTFSSS